MTDPTIEILSGPEAGLSPKYPQFSAYQERLQGRAGVSVFVLLSEEVQTGRSLMRRADST